MVEEHFIYYSCLLLGEVMFNTQLFFNISHLYQEDRCWYYLSKYNIYTLMDILNHTSLFIEMFWQFYPPYQNKSETLREIYLAVN